MVNYLRGLEFAAKMCEGVNRHFTKILTTPPVTPVAPFQFVFPILKELYRGFSGDQERLRPRVFWDSNKKRPKWHAENPEDYDDAHTKSPIRAIAFLNWEETRRVFLLRRVFPSFFGFLSYSQCPEDWGAVGYMLAEMREEKDSFFKRKWKAGKVPACTQVNEFLQYAMPFLGEAERLNARAICVFPVIKNRNSFKGSHELEGAFLVLLKNEKFLPSVSVRTADRSAFVRAAADLSAGISNLLKRQDELFREAKQFHAVDLPKLWLEKAKEHAHVRVVQLEFHPEAIGNRDPGAVTSLLVSALNRAGLYCVIEGPPANTGKPISILVAPPPVLTKQLDEADLYRSEDISEVVRAIADHSDEGDFLVRVKCIKCDKGARPHRML